VWRFHVETAWLRKVPPDPKSLGGDALSCQGQLDEEPASYPGEVIASKSRAKEHHIVRRPGDPGVFIMYSRIDLAGV
jgi:hypothetical protein